jgi:hypothetical protein
MEYQKGQRLEYSEALHHGFIYAHSLCPLPFAEKNEELLRQAAYVAAWLHLGVNPNPKMIPDVIIYILRSTCFPDPGHWDWIAAVEVSVQVLADCP